MNLETELAVKNNNKVFKHIYFIPNSICNEFSYHEEYYLVRDGKVYLIQEPHLAGGQFYPTGDSIIETCTRGIPCGKFSELKKYKRIVKFFKVSDFKKRMTTKYLKSL